MAFNGKHAGRVVQLLADIFTDALERAAAWTVGVVRFVMDQGAWKLCRQCRALGLLLFLGRRWGYLQGLKLGLNRCDIGIDQVIEQAGLIRIHLLTAFGKLQALELRDLVGQLLDDRLIAVDLLAHCLDCLIETFHTLHQLRCQSAQLFRGKVVEIGGRSHDADFARAGSLQR